MLTQPRRGAGEDATPAEVAWHFHAVEPSGWMYYGCPNLDMQDKPTIRCVPLPGIARAVAAPT